MITRSCQDHAYYEYTEIGGRGIEYKYECTQNVNKVKKQKLWGGQPGGNNKYEYMKLLTRSGKLNVDNKKSTTNQQRRTAHSHASIYHKKSYWKQCDCDLCLKTLRKKKHTFWNSCTTGVISVIHTTTYESWHVLTWLSGNYNFNSFHLSTQLCLFVWIFTCSWMTADKNIKKKNLKCNKKKPFWIFTTFWRHSVLKMRSRSLKEVWARRLQ